MTRVLVWLGGVAACGAPNAGATDAAIDGAIEDAIDDADLTADAHVLPASGTFRQTCDGSAGVTLDATHFLNLNDEDQRVMIYARGADAGPVQTRDISTMLGTAIDNEVDLEGVARRDNRIYMISSHGRNTSGRLRPERSRFAAFDVTGDVPSAQLAVVGTTYENILRDMLVESNWHTPNTTVIGALDASSQLGTTTSAQLAPEINGTNIEGLAILPQGLAIGFRNPRPGGKALVVTLTNPDAVLAGATAVFGTATLLDLGGLAIRDMAWSTTHGKILVLAGPHDSSVDFKLYLWSGVATDPAVLARPVPINAAGSPEAVIPYAGSRDVQLLYDQGDATIGSGICKDAVPAERVFRDVFVHID